MAQHHATPARKPEPVVTARDLAFFTGGFGAAATFIAALITLFIMDTSLDERRYLTLFFIAIGALFMLLHSWGAHGTGEPRPYHQLHELTWEEAAPAAAQGNHH